MQKTYLKIIYLSFFAGILFLNNSAFCQVKVVKDINTELPKNEKEALIILPGFGDSKKGQKKQLAFFKNKGFDVYIPDYKDKVKVDSCLANFTAFYEQENIEEYKKVHIFSYLIGAWTLNKFINQYGIKNIRTIVYDRSPIQERAPFIAFNYLKIPSRIKFGPILEDFLNTPYPSIENDSVNIGMIIENKATKFMRLYEKKTLKMGELNWHVDSLYQDTDDYFYTWLNHDQMYVRFDVVGEEILHFIHHRKFSKSAKKENYNWDPFVSYKKEGLK